MSSMRSGCAGPGAPRRPFSGRVRAGPRARARSARWGTKSDEGAPQVVARSASRVAVPLEDGRTLVAFSEGAEVGWVCHLDGDEHRMSAGRSVADALRRALGDAQAPWGVERLASAISEALGARD